MRKWFSLLKLKLRAYMLQEQALHAEDLMADHQRRYELLILELRKVKARIAMLESPSVMLRQALRRT